MKTVQRPRRSKDRISLFKFGGCGDFYVRPYGVGEDAGCPTMAGFTKYPTFTVKKNG